MSNEKFYEAVLRDALPISRAYGDKGWPLLLYPWFLALVQLPNAEKPAQRAFMLHMGDCIRAGALPAVRQRIPWFIENEVIEPHVNAQDFAAWLAQEGKEPSPLIQEWFKHQGVARPAPTPALATAVTPAIQLLLDAMPLPEEIRVSDAANILGGGRLRENELINLVASGALVSWSHSPKVGDQTECKNHKLGENYYLPRITDTTDPESVLLDGEDVLWKWCVHFEQGIHAPHRPPKEAIEQRREYILEMHRTKLLGAAPRRQEAEPQAVASVVAESPSNGPAKPMQRSAAQAAAILSAIQKAGHDPLALPVNEPGKPGVKAEIRTALGGKGLFSGTTVFDKAWDRLRLQGDIADKA